jgi:AcrR family transcriptional regulator
MSTADTKTTILDAAEALFAEHGFVATSLRQLTTRAGVNLAAVNYHFGSKDELARAVLLRRIAPVNAERRRRLDALPQPATVEHVVRAFVEPVLRAGELVGGENRPGRAADWCRLVGRINVEQPPFLRAFLR